MEVSRVNTINLGLILLSLAASMVVPFELFLLAYAILGPLHYLTEISWLADRKYFVPGKLDWVPLWVLGGLGVLLIPGVFGPDPVVQHLEFLPRGLLKWRYDVAFLGFGVALFLVLTKNLLLRLAGLLLLVAVLEHFRADGLFIKLFAVYLPSLIHVFVFTGLFMLWGAMKGNSRSGYVTLLAFVAAGAAALFAPGAELVQVSGWATHNFVAAFDALTRTVLADVGFVEGQTALRLDLFEHPRAVAVVRFFGFAYTYHYLNWFSKTSIIKWHEIPISRKVSILVLWLASVGLYLFDYGLGLSWLFALSFAHVLLEFPLNHRSFSGIAFEIRRKVLSPRGD